MNTASALAQTSCARCTRSKVVPCRKLESQSRSARRRVLARVEWRRSIGRSDFSPSVGLGGGLEGWRESFGKFSTSDFASVEFLRVLRALFSIFLCVMLVLWFQISHKAELMRYVWETRCTFITSNHWPRAYMCLYASLLTRKIGFHIEACCFRWFSNFLKRKIIFAWGLAY